MNKITGFMTAVAAAAFLSISPVSAQTGTQPESSFALNEPDRLEFREAMRAKESGYQVGETLPEMYPTSPVPQDVVERVPAVGDVHYFTLADGRIALVDENSREILDILE